MENFTPKKCIQSEIKFSLQNAFKMTSEKAAKQHSLSTEQNCIHLGVLWQSSNDERTFGSNFGITLKVVFYDENLISNILFRAKIFLEIRIYKKC